MKGDLKDTYPWLDEMMNAALDDDPVSTAPDFPAIREKSSGHLLAYGTPGRIRSRRARLYAVAAAVLVAAVSLPAGFIIGNRSADRRMTREINTLFVEELISGNLFEESLFDNNIGSGDGWISEIEVDVDYFDI